MTRYRSKLRIIADILHVVRDGARRTRIMYQANLSYKLLVRYLSEVLKAGLVRFENHEYYVLTDRGKKFLDKFYEYSERRKSVEKKLNDIMDQKIILENMFGEAKAVEENTIQNKKELDKK